MAVELALESGLVRADHVLNVLGRLQHPDRTIETVASRRCVIRRCPIRPATTPCGRQIMSTPDLPLRMQQLKHGMASQWPELLAKMRLHTMEPEHWMAELLQAESAERQVRAQANQMKAARFPVHRDLLGFDFAASPVDRALVERLHQGDFIHTPERVLVGGPGTGKTHLATAIGIQAVRQHRLRVRFFSTIELVNALEKEQARARPGRSPCA